jgi:hypothetical protein
MSAESDRHLLGPGPKRVLALDGGGTRGVIELAFLERIEGLLRAQHGGDPNFRLCDWFDLIGGTSTGAIIAACLATGMSVAEVTALYLTLAPQAFQGRFWRIPGLAARFDARLLTRLLSEHFGDCRLDSDKLRTGVAILARRYDTGSPWIPQGTLLGGTSRSLLYWQPLLPDCGRGASQHRCTRIFQSADASRGSQRAGGSVYRWRNFSLQQPLPGTVDADPSSRVWAAMEAGA